MYSGKLYPNGEFGVTRAKRMAPYVPPKKWNKEEVRWNVERYRQHGYEAAALAAWNDRAGGEAYDDSHQAATIGSSMVSNSHRRAKRGTLGITRYGAKMVRNAAFLLQRRYGKERLSFLTLTLPSLSREHWKVICEKWSNVVRVFIQRLQRFLVKNALPSFVISVTEIQEERHSKEAVPGLHLHMVFVGAKRRWQWKLSPRTVRGWWKEIVSASLGCSAETYFWGSVERLETVKKDAASYLGKYLSKGSASIRLVMQTCVYMPLPTSWWNCTMNLRKWVKREIVPLTGQRGAQLWHLRSYTLDKLCQWWKEITVETTGGQDFVLSIAGRVKPERLKTFLKLLE